MPEKRIHLYWNLPVTNDDKPHKAYVPSVVGIMTDVTVRSDPYNLLQTQSKQKNDIIRSPQHSPMFTTITIKGMCIVSLIIISCWNNEDSVLFTNEVSNL